MISSIYTVPQEKTSTAGCHVRDGEARIQQTTRQRNIYPVTRPCRYSNQCPRDKEVPEREATTDNTASKFPSSASPLAARRGAITARSNADDAKDVVSERMDSTGRYWTGATIGELPLSNASSAGSASKICRSR